MIECIRMRRMKPATIALLTDFGTQDVYAGVMKAVIARMAPAARVIDLTHEVRPGDIRSGAFRLWQAFPYLPPRTVVLAVVDPGVGTARKAVAVPVSDLTFVCPDNGLLTFVLARGENVPARREGAPGKEIRAFEIAPPSQGDPTVSATFHGRDIFAPAAARLLTGAAPDDLGPRTGPLVRLSPPRLSLSVSPLSVRGEILSSDRFGNLVSSIGVLRREGSVLNLEPWLPGCPSASLPSKGLRVRLNGAPEIPLVSTYGEVPPGTLLAYVGSDGLLEIGANGDRAVDRLGPMTDREIILHAGGDGA
jgi:hypothetical protein